MLPTTPGLSIRYTGDPTEWTCLAAAASPDMVAARESSPSLLAAMEISDSEEEENTGNTLPSVPGATNVSHLDQGPTAHDIIEVLDSDEEQRSGYTRAAKSNALLGNRIIGLSQLPDP